MTQGSGDEFARLDLGDFGTYVIEDDGDPDTYVRSYVEYDGCERTSNPAARVMELRGQGMSDSDIKDAFEDLERRLNHDPMTRPDDDSSPSASSLGGPVAFKCDECARTCPRTWNTNPGGGSDVCKECAEDDDA